MPSFNEQELINTVKNSFSIAEVARLLGLCTTGGNHQTIKKYISLWNINIEHFTTPSQRAKMYLSKPPLPLETILVKNCLLNGTNLKQRLFSMGLKKPICELCGQNEIWQGKQMSLILDHINGVRDDNRLENLRILCPNCNATLDTHCGKQAKNKCPGCTKLKSPKKKYCSQKCYLKHKYHQPKFEKRKVIRPSYQKLKEEIEKTSYVAVGKKYGVSDNAIRKWLRIYEKYGEQKR